LENGQQTVEQQNREMVPYNRIQDHLARGAQAAAESQPDPQERSQVFFFEKTHPAKVIAKIYHVCTALFFAEWSRKWSPQLNA
jgi:hypothetical protein